MFFVYWFVFFVYWFVFFVYWFMFFVYIGKISFLSRKHHVQQAASDCLATDSTVHVRLSMDCRFFLEFVLMLMVI